MTLHEFVTKHLVLPDGIYGTTKTEESIARFMEVALAEAKHAAYLEGLEHGRSMLRTGVEAGPSL